ncbi:MAG: helix-turn-helix domain-containing protein [Prevotellaceae bacterium]|jgi:transcriptional regulator with XRE-family HTH domain|nr:helix-turn-helix domain-containing protein [Prevotellaceae bacterium]
MKTTITDRLILIIRQLGLSNNAFAEKIGISQQTLFNYTKGRIPSVDVVEKIINKYPEINTDWLVTGRGEMQKIENNQQVGNIENSTAVGVNVFGSNNSFKVPEKDVQNSIQNYQETIKKQSETIEKLVLIIENLSKKC